MSLTGIDMSTVLAGSNGELCLVVGFDQTTSWSIATVVSNSVFWKEVLLELTRGRNTLALPMSKQDPTQMRLIN